MNKLGILGGAVVCLALSGCANLVSWEGDEPERVVHVPAPEPLPERPVGPEDHWVRKGDTVYSISFRNQLDYREVAKWNGLGSDYLIRPGQVLRLTPAPPIRNGEIESRPVELEVAGRPTPLAIAPRPVPVPANPPPAAPTGAPTGAPIAQQGVAASALAAASVPRSSLDGGGRNGWQWPTDGVVFRGYAPDQGSKGLDFTGEVGQPVYAAAAGKVVYSGGALKGYGELIIIKHDDLRLSAYGYNQSRLVSEGDLVAAGQRIAMMGLGPESKPALHFEVRERGKPVNPVSFLPIRQSASRRAS